MITLIVNNVRFFQMIASGSLYYGKPLPATFLKCSLSTPSRRCIFGIILAFAEFVGSGSTDEPNGGRPF
ncbi:MAG: hypothetical protein O2856_13505, partial [Planctomycetota bacterium]|nr:hypothetical protein [Planctomycetota bacterium]